MAGKGWRVRGENGVCFLPTSQRVRCRKTSKTIDRGCTKTASRNFFRRNGGNLASPEASIVIKAGESVARRKNTLL